MTRSRSQSGMTLIEVLISILIFALGVLGLVAMQSRATVISTDAEDRNRAALLGNEAAALLWQYVPTAGAIPAGAYSQWQTMVSTPTNTATGSAGLLGLPNGAGTIVNTTPPAVGGVWTVTITWTPKNGSAHQYITQVTVNP